MSRAKLFQNITNYLRSLIITSDTQTFLFSSGDIDVRSVSLNKLFLPRSMRRQSSIRAFCVPAMSVAAQMAQRGRGTRNQKAQGKAAKALGLDWPHVARRRAGRPGKAALSVSALTERSKIRAPLRT